MIDDGPVRAPDVLPKVKPEARRINGGQVIESSPRKYRGNTTSGGRRNGGHSAYRQLVDGLDRLARAVESVTAGLEASNPAVRFTHTRAAREMLAAARGDITRARNVAGRIEKTVLDNNG